jgi:hypothetical protein
MKAWPQTASAGLIPITSMQADISSNPSGLASFASPHLLHCVCIHTGNKSETLLEYQCLMQVKVLQHCSCTTAAIESNTNFVTKPSTITVVSQAQHH